MAHCASKQQLQVQKTARDRFERLEQELRLQKTTPAPTDSSCCKLLIPMQLAWTYTLRAMQCSAGLVQTANSSAEGMLLLLDRARPRNEGSGGEGRRRA